MRSKPSRADLAREICDCKERLLYAQNYSDAIACHRRMIALLAADSDLISESDLAESDKEAELKINIGRAAFHSDHLDLLTELADGDDDGSIAGMIRSRRRARNSRRLK